MKKIIFNIIDLLFIQPYEGFIEFLKGIKSFFRKPKNLIFLMIFSLVFLLVTGYVASLQDKILPPIFYMIYSLALLLVLIWKRMTSGESKERWRKYLNKKIEKEEMEKFNLKNL